jgi:hypothetical protein
MNDDTEYLLEKSNRHYYGNNIDYDKLFKMLVTVYTKAVCIYGYIFCDKCNICNRVINNMDDIYYNGIELSKYEIHEYLYHNIDYPNNIKSILYEYRDVISDMYYRYLRRL